MIGLTTGGTHLIRLRGDNKPMNALHAPAAVHELGSEPIEQLRMRWRLAVLAEVSDAGDDRTAEMAQPDMVNRHSRGKRIFAARDPTRESETASTGGFRISFADRCVPFGRLFQRFLRRVESLLGRRNLLFVTPRFR